MSEWHARNQVDPTPPGEARLEFNRLSQHIREWHPDYNIGDRVRRRALGGPALGQVEGFCWRGTHLMATVQFDDRCETFAASEYVP
jgi:hypothetical protein